ncbi:MAG: hypothetical protein AAF171_18190 [Cyanobacteria bacterium P01_A01_bin.116]
MRLKASIIAGGVAIALPLIIGVYQVWPRSESSDWQPLANAAPPGLLMQIGEEHLSSGFDEQLGQMKMMQPWQSGQMRALYLIDSRAADLSTGDNPLCGAIGCAFFAYVPTEEGFQNVLNLYLDPHLPPDISLIETSEILHNDMPELIIHQLEGDQLIQIHLVLNNEQYEVIETQYLPTE